MPKESSPEETIQFMKDLEAITSRAEALDTRAACMLHLLCAAIYAGKIKDLMLICVPFAIDVLDLEPFKNLDTSIQH